MQQIEGLTIAVEELQKEATQLRGVVSENTAVLHRRSYAGGAIALILALILLGSLIRLSQQSRTTREIAENNRRLCPLISLLVLQPGDPPPPTERGRRVASSAATLYSQFQCRAG